MDVLPPVAFVNPRSAIMTPGNVRGFSLESIGAQESTVRLHEQLQGSLIRNALGSLAIQRSIALGLTVHRDDWRTYQPYSDHLLEVATILVDEFGIRDPAIIAAAPAHDSLEDHAQEVVEYYGGGWIDDEATAREVGRHLLAEDIGQESADLVWAVTNPIRSPNQDRQTINAGYAERTDHLVRTSPKGRVLKLADFFRNAVDNHLTTKPGKQRQIDEKTFGVYPMHLMGLYLPDSLITGPRREVIAARLIAGHHRAAGRLALAPLM